MIKTTVFPSPAGNFNMVSSVPDTGPGPWPVFIMFPGDGEAGNDPTKAYVNGPLAVMKNNNWNPTDKILVFAQTPYHGGTYGNPVALPFLRAAIQSVVNNLPVDKSKIFLTGLSYGADHVMYYIQKEDPAYYVPIAGVITMSMGVYGSVGNSPNDSLGGNDIRFSKMRIIGFCGNQDPFLNPMQRFYNVLLKSAGYNEDFILYNGGHCCWNQFYDNNYKGPKGLNIYDDELQSTSSSPIVVTPPPVTTPKTVKSVVAITTFSDGSTQNTTIV